MDERVMAFWETWMELASAEDTGKAQRELENGREAAQAGFDRVRKTRVNYSSKKRRFHAYTFPEIQRLRCWNALPRIAGKRNPLEKVYEEIGFLRRCDKAELVDAGGASGRRIEVRIHNTFLKDWVLDYYCRRWSLPSSAEDLRHDMAIVRKFLDYSAECVIDNFLSNHLGDTAE